MSEAQRLDKLVDYIIMTFVSCAHQLIECMFVTTKIILIRQHNFKQ